MASSLFRYRLNNFVLERESVSSLFKEGKPVQKEYTKVFIDHVRTTENRQCRVDYCHPGPKVCTIVLCCSNKTCKKAYKFRAQTSDLKKDDDVIFEIFANDKLCNGKNQIISNPSNI